MKFPTRIFDLFYGQSGAGKSEAAKQIIEEYLKQNPGMMARVVIGDGSLATYDHLIEQGVVEALEFNNRAWPLPTVQRMTEGWFPIDGPQGEMLPPEKQPNFDKVGIYVFEGAAVTANYIMSNIRGGLADLAGEGHKMGQDSPFQIPQGEVDDKGKFKDKDARNFGGNSQTHYGIAQRHVVDAVNRSKGLAKYVIWTSHEYTNDPSTSQIVKETIVGPEISGKALTASFQKLFGNTLHFQTVATKTKTMDTATKKERTELDLDYRIWTCDHFSPDNNTMIRYKALVRGVRGMQKYYKDIAEFYVDLDTHKKEGGVDTAPAV